MSEIQIVGENFSLPGDLEAPPETSALVIFAHGSGSSRLSSRNRRVAADLRASGRLGTLLFDLLTPEEDSQYSNRFDIELLAQRLLLATEFARSQPQLEHVPLGYFGASTGAAAALVAASRLQPQPAAVVSRGGRPDLAGSALTRVHAPTLLIVGGRDLQVIGLNQMALSELGSHEKRLELVPGATHLFEESGTLEEVSRLAVSWFEHYLSAVTT
jgi:putative phosphoribosyl transferase